MGFSLLKNMLQFELEYTGESKDIQMVTSQFQGKFMNIGIKDKDKDMLVPFPLSLLAWNSKGEQIKQYLVATQPDVDREDNIEVKVQQLKRLQG